MKKFQEKKNFSNIMQSRPALIVLGIIVIAFTWNVLGLVSRMEETAKNRKVEEQKIADLLQRKDKLSTDIASLKTEKGVEENIREKFGLVKEGEQMIVVVDEKKQSDITNKDKSSGFINFFKKIFNK